MTRKFEVHVRCASCRADAFIAVEVRGATGAICTADVVRAGRPQLSRFSCPKCQGQSGRIAGVMEMKKTTSARGMSPSEADRIAVSAFAFIADSEVRLARFLADTGIEPETVRKAARTPAFLRGVLDYVLGDIDLLADAAEALVITPEVLATAAKCMSRPQPTSAPAAPAGKMQDIPAKGPVGLMPRREMFREKRGGEAA